MSKDALKSAESRKSALSERMKILSDQIRNRLFPYDGLRICRLTEMSEEAESLGFDTSYYRNQIASLEIEWPKGNLRDYLDNTYRPIETQLDGVDEVMIHAHEKAGQKNDDLDNKKLSEIISRLKLFLASISYICEQIDQFLTNAKNKIKSEKDNPQSMQYERIFKRMLSALLERKIDSIELQDHAKKLLKLLEGKKV